MRAQLESQHARNIAHAAIKRKFTNNNLPLNERGGKLSTRHQDSQGDRQIESRSCLPQPAWRQVHNDLVCRHGEAACPNRRPHPFARFLNSRVGHSDNRHTRQAARDAHLDVNQPCLYPMQRRAPHPAVSVPAHQQAENASR